MINKLFNKIRKKITYSLELKFVETINQSKINHEELLLLSAKSILVNNEFKAYTNINNYDRLFKYEFSIFSQFGDDGIIQFLVNYLDINEKKFIEFGVTDYIESNTRFLLMNNNWEGLVMDGNQDAVNTINNSYYYWKYNLIAKKLWVTKNNINDFIKDNGFNGEIGLLHIDLDGNDYWIWEALESVSPIIFIAEFNSVFSLNPYTVPYSESFYRTSAHHSNLYWGCGLTAICELSSKKGYSFIGCNSAGNNAYFVRNDKLKDIKPLSPEEGYVKSKYRESRNRNGSLSFISGDHRLEEIKGLPVYNVIDNKIQVI